MSRIGAGVQAVIDRIAAVDASIPVNRERAEGELARHFAALDLPVPSVQWVDDPSEASGLARDAGGSNVWSAALTAAADAAVAAMREGPSASILLLAGLAGVAAFAGAFVGLSLLAALIRSTLDADPNPFINFMVFVVSAGAASGAFARVRTSFGVVGAMKGARWRALGAAAAARAWNKTWISSQQANSATECAGAWQRASSATDAVEKERAQVTAHLPGGVEPSVAETAGLLAFREALAASAQDEERLRPVDRLVTIMTPWLDAYEAGLWLFWIAADRVLAIPRPAPG